jgi:uncharacterized metal-binding protein
MSPGTIVGVVSCSGECCALGTLSRVATRFVLENLRRNNTTTICLPLFLAGGEGERMFAKAYPTISVDGCGRECAKRAIEKYSNKTASSIIVEDLIKNWGLAEPASRGELDDDGLEAAMRVAEEIAATIDLILLRGMRVEHA